MLFNFIEFVEYSVETVDVDSVTEFGGLVIREYFVYNVLFWGSVPVCPAWIVKGAIATGVPMNDFVPESNEKVSTLKYVTGCVILI